MRRVGVHIFILLVADEFNFVEIVATTRGASDIGVKISTSCFVWDLAKLDRPVDSAELLVTTGHEVTGRYLGLVAFTLL